MGRFVGTKGRANGLRGIQDARVIVDQTGTAFADEPLDVGAVGIDANEPRRGRETARSGSNVGRTKVPI